ncbi:hypothetical protein [Zooshikella harenae]|uniref:SIR2-like domain-containing protein n=1 Tax=Zooshikella harenae TaxID=2827238 RepID=A0ABS5Z781_9GAMM|nr:hypothetical protein [Zooshikella harenae]MBU2709859.1 hypothetical protein [Zooshikella harenae]
MIRYLTILHSGKGKPFDIRAISSFNGKVIIFIGGLLHLNGFELGAGLGALLHSLCSKSGSHYLICTVVLSEKPIISVHKKDMHAAAKDGVLLPYADQISLDLLFPRELISLWKGVSGDKQLNTMSAYFKKIIFVGYSYGNSIVQQIEYSIRMQFKRHGLPLLPLENVQAINIGPCILPRLFSSINGEVVSLVNRSEINSKNNEHYDQGVFNQVFFIFTQDRFMIDTIGDELLPYDYNDIQICTYYINNKRFIIDNGENSLTYKLWVRQLPCGSFTGQLDFCNDPFAHDLTTYCNIETVINTPTEGDVVTYPSSFLGEAIRITMNAMMNGNYEHQLLSFSSVNKIFYRYQEKKAKLESLINKYRHSNLSESVGLVQREFARVGEHYGYYRIR